MTPNKAATLIADKYVGRNGQAIDLETSHHQRLEDITAVASFLVWMPDNAMWGGVRAEEALLAFARLLDIPVAKLRSLKIPDKKE